MIVLDASAVIELLLQSARGIRVRDVLERDDAIAPAHMDAEVFSALGRLVQAGELDDASATQRLRRLRTLPVQRRPLRPLLDRAWELRGNVSLRDALYVSLAQRTGSRVLTLDGRLASAVPEWTVLVRG